VHLLGARLPSDAWSYARPRELLVHLLCHPEGRTRDQIGEALWPEGSVAQLKNSFHVTLHHLRRTLGAPEWVVIDDDRYRLNPARGTALDAFEFERLIRAALPARGQVADRGGVARLETALSHYRGDFLEGEVTSGWHMELRDRWLALFLDGLVALGDGLLAMDEMAPAAQAFRRVVARDDLHEGAHRRLMTALARMGQRADALRQYQRLTESLSDALGAEPEPETTHLVERIRLAEMI
jgi:DNA-binding SARP family transcriptional activator